MREALLHPALLDHRALQRQRASAGTRAICLAVIVVTVGHTFSSVPFEPVGASNSSIRRTAAANIDYVLSGGSREQRINELLKRVGLEHLRDRGFTHADGAGEADDEGLVVAFRHDNSAQSASS